LEPSLTLSLPLLAGGGDERERERQKEVEKMGGEWSADPQAAATSLLS
jgi:hypothetical protein